MKFRGWIAALALVGMAMTSSAARAQATKVDDGTLKTRIETKLKSSASLKEDTINVGVENGVVTLTGKVHSLAQKATAASLARVEGVTTVENKLDVDSATERKMDGAAAKTDRAIDKTAAETKKAAENTKDAVVTATEKTKDATANAADKTKDAAGKAADKTKEGTATAGDKTKDAAVKAADKTKAAGSATGEAITDAWVTTKLKADFVDEELLKGSNINVDTNNHVVTLKGTVKSVAGKNRAADIAKKTKGVQSIVNMITIAPKS
ncbi:MAG: BON domain-containing protein [Acidobacteriota bacterium]